MSPAMSCSSGVRDAVPANQLRGFASSADHRLSSSEIVLWIHRLIGNIGAAFEKFTKN